MIYEDIQQRKMDGSPVVFYKLKDQVLSDLNDYVLVDTALLLEMISREGSDEAIVTVDNKGKMYLLPDGNLIALLDSDISNPKSRIARIFNGLDFILTSFELRPNSGGSISQQLFSSITFENIFTNHLAYNQAFVYDTTLGIFSPIGYEWDSSIDDWNIRRRESHWRLSYRERRWLQDGIADKIYMIRDTLTKLIDNGVFNPQIVVRQLE